MSKITIVTGLWDIGRSGLSNDWARSMDHYLNKFKELLKIDENMIIFGDTNLQKFVMEHRDPTNTQFILRSSDWFKNNDYFENIQSIRLNEGWLNQTGWLRDSTQAKLELYNPLVMSKMFLLNDARIMDRFNSDHMYWLDAGITNTVHPGYFTHDKVFDKIDKYVDKFSFVSFPYEGASEIHGFNLEELNKLAGSNVKLVSRGGFFGGPKDTIEELNGIYYQLLIETLSKSLMGTEESLFSLITYKYPTKVTYFEIEYNGLIGKFFENLKNDNLTPKQTEIKLTNSITFNPPSKDNVGLYVITFNSPNQFETLVKSMLDYDPDFINKTRKILLDNSTDLTTTPRYSELCSQYGFEHVKKENLGICGGRQWVAEHFDKSSMDYMWFSEDDMFFQNNNETCKNGFNRYTPNLFEKCLKIIQKEDFDFLKINFTEFFGDNSTQWSWYNLPQLKREEYFPNKPNLPVQGLDPNPPRTKFNNINSLDGLPYVDGEIYYCNWTHIISKEGNKKMFIDTTWAHPFESTWMSHHYQMTKQNKLKGGLLLLTPIEHNRFDHYSRELRKES